MAEIIVEPTCLAFNLAFIDHSFANEKEELAIFGEFIKNLLVLTEELKKRNVKIGLSRELYDIYKNSVPVNVYYQPRSLGRLSNEFFARRLPEVFRIIHEYGAHQMTITLSEAEIDKGSKLFDEEAYHHLLDLMGVILMGKIPPVALSSDRKTIFSSHTVTIMSDSIQRCVTVVRDVEKVTASDEYSNFIFLRDLEKRSGVITEVSCRGTGTHSSMWGNKINNITDVPKAERALLQKLIETGSVLSITFLAFDNNCTAVDEPMIVINDIEEMESCDMMKCKIIGKGKKQNSQDIKIEVVKGHGDKFCRLFKKVITISKLNNIGA